MIKKFENITKIENRKLYDEVSTYCDDLIDEATANGSLDEQGADNEYTREIGRVGRMCADYETYFMTFKCIKFKSPLVHRMEGESAKSSLKQRQTAFSQIMREKRPDIYVFASN